MEQNIDKSSVWKPAIEAFKEKFELPENDVRTYSPLAFAYIGDTVYDMIFRTIVVSRKNMAAHKYHKEVCRYVSAVAQSKMVEVLKDIWTDEEEAMYRRGRNSNPYNKAKNASVIEYQRATGLECLMGYLYLKGDFDRIMELVKYGLEHIDDSED